VEETDDERSKRMGASSREQGEARQILPTADVAELGSTPAEREFFCAPAPPPQVEPDILEQAEPDPLLTLRMSPVVRARRAALARLATAVVAGAFVLCVQALVAEARVYVRGHPSLAKSAMRSMQAAP
jgi:hypothetical protein